MRKSGGKIRSLDNINVARRRKRAKKEEETKLKQIENLKKYKFIKKYIYSLFFS